jgi:hypothetical protein
MAILHSLQAHLIYMHQQLSCEQSTAIDGDNLTFYVMIEIWEKTAHRENIESKDSL